MDIKCKIADYRIERSESVKLFAGHPDFYIRKSDLEKAGYTCSSEVGQGYGKMYLYTKPNKVLATIIDEFGRVYDEVNLRNLIANYYNVQKLHKGRIEDFVQQVESGKIKLVYKSNYDFFTIEF